MADANIAFLYIFLLCGFKSCMLCDTPSKVLHMTFYEEMLNGALHASSNKENAPRNADIQERLLTFLWFVLFRKGSNTIKVHLSLLVILSLIIQFRFSVCTAAKDSRFTLWCIV